MSTIRERLALEADAGELRRIRRLWQQHSIAEERRDVDGLIATLTPECVYEIVGSGLRWTGHDGARAFYTELFAAFPDNRFTLTDIVIGPQGVFEAVVLEATHRGTFAGLQATDRPVRLDLTILFPWDPTSGRFEGEKIYLDRKALDGGSAGWPGATPRGWQP